MTTEATDATELFLGNGCEGRFFEKGFRLNFSTCINEPGHDGPCVYVALESIYTKHGALAKNRPVLITVEPFGGWADDA